VRTSVPYDNSARTSMLCLLLHRLLDACLSTTSTVCMPVPLLSRLLSAR
jgi:hypothetical protein